jgi:phage FluMu gp28-like protein
MARKPKTEKRSQKRSGAAKAPLGRVGSKNKDLIGPEFNLSGVRATKSRGRPPKFSDDIKELARLDYLAGDSATEIAKRIGCTPPTIRNWVKRGGWQRALEQRRQSVDGLEAQIARLTVKKSLTNPEATRLSMLTKALDRLNKSLPKPKARPVVQNAIDRDLLSRVLSADYGLYEFQTEFIKSEARFRVILKARQIGFSWVVGLAVLLGAAAGRDQLIFSASQDQADHVISYVHHHAERLGVEVVKDKGDIRVNGSLIKALSTNYRTAQGWPGDVWLDEFAWVINQKALWGAVIPSITQVGGRVTVFSTPFLPGSHFWKIATNHQGAYGFFERTTITIQQAIEQGMPLPGGLEELRMLFDADTWAMFYECQWAEDGSALLSWDMLHQMASGDIRAEDYGRLQGGADVGRINDRFAEALVGQRINGHSFDDTFALIHTQMEKGASFAKQKALITETDNRFDVEAWRIDKTGLGMQLAEEMSERDPRFQGVWFTAKRKSKMALNLLKLGEDKRLILPNDPDVLAQLHAVKKLASGSGSTIRYDAERTKDGHADLFWAVALAADGRASLKGGDGGGNVVETW